MSDFIDRETLKKILNTLVKGEIKDLLRIVDSVPKADVEPVRHAKWIKCENHLRNSDGKSIMLLGYVYECSLCSRKEATAEPYCNCGAKMDLKEKQNATS